MKHAAVATFSAIVVAACGAGRRTPGTDPPLAPPAQAQEYLSLLDSGRLSEAWEMSSPNLRACSATGDALDIFVRKRRDLFGELQSRTLHSVREKKRVSGLPKIEHGKYVELRYDASYSGITKAIDLLVLWPDGQGSYRIARYCTGSVGVDGK